MRGKEKSRRKEKRKGKIGKNSLDMLQPQSNM
jgi:hypothetical protein